MASSGREGGRSLKTRVKTGAGRTTSSKTWLQRQLNDPYVAQARREGYRSRAAYKLIEIDDRFHLFKPGQTVLDLGAAPGGWSQVAAKRVKPATGRGRVVGIDLIEIETLPDVDVRVMDFLAPDAPQALKDWLGGPVDVVLSDMAANATGHRKTDHLRIVGLVESAAAFVTEVLAPAAAFSPRFFRAGRRGTCWQRSSATSSVSPM